MRKGIPQIKIPIRPSELSIQKVEPYLPSVFSQFCQNSSKIRRDYDFYCLSHPIEQKVRTHDDTDVNNIVLIPDMNYMVNWKAGYACGNPIKYAQSKTMDTDDISYLNKHIRSSKKRTVDKEVVTWAYAVGKGFYFIEPKSGDFDAENEAPYVLYCRDADTCAKVYSSFDGGDALFDILYTKVKECDAEGKEKTVEYYDIYFPDTMYTYKVEFGTKPEKANEQTRGIAKPLPLVEKVFNRDCIGMVAMGKSMQEAVDKLVSNGLDNIEDIVNQIIVYKNCNLGDTAAEQAENHREGMRNGCLVLNSASKEFPADVDTLKTELSLAEVRELFSIINENFHATLGVPIAMSNTNSGNTTKSGSEVANGYDNAYNHALNDVNSFLAADQELLEKILWICKNTAGNKIDKIAASDIEIKYSLNLTDNILTKTQSYVNLTQAGVPPTIALRICKLSNDPEAEGKLIEEYAAQMEKKAAEQAASQQNPNGNNSQE